MKRVLDFVIALFALIILSPLFVTVSLLILCIDGGPVIFRQKRVGYKNELFDIYKFRTMLRNTGDHASEEIESTPEQITKTGRFLRKSSIDELPQLINVLNGTMSFVGPRPTIPAEDELRKLRAQYNVFSVRPGITGYAQINGRDNVSCEKKALLDKEYVEKQSILFDLKILFKTVGKVLKSTDINS